MLMGALPLQVEEFGQRGIRCMAVARTDADGQWHMLGLLTFLDPPRPDTRATLETALHYGVQARMVSWALTESPSWHRIRAVGETSLAPCIKTLTRAEPMLLSSGEWGLWIQFERFMCMLSHHCQVAGKGGNHAF